MPLGGAKHANFFKIGNFKCHSLTHQTSCGYQIVSFATKVGALVDCQLLARSLRNWGRYFGAKFWKIAKICQSLGSPNSS